MAIRIIREKGDSVLAEQAKEVKRFDATLSRLVEDMFDTMHHYNGIGLAAPQIGIPKQIVVIDTQAEGQRVAMINPRIVSAEGTEIDVEGCLSIPGVYGEVERPDTIIVRFLDVSGQNREIVAEGLFARVVSHEFDHLCGRLFDERVLRFIPKEELENHADDDEA